MKRLFVSFLTLSTCIVYAQENKPTGGCVYTGSIEHFSPALYESNYFLPRTTYSITVLLNADFQTCMGTITIKLNNNVVGERKYSSSGEYTIPLDVTSIVPGAYTLIYAFDGGWNGDTMDTKNVYVMNVVKTAIDSIADDFSVYPNPSSDDITIDISNDIILNMAIVNTAGQLIRNLTCSASKVKLLVDDLPVGLYLLQVQTEKNAFVQKLQVAR